MLKFFKRRRPTTVDVADPLAIRNLLDQPALRALVVDGDQSPDELLSMSWSRLAAAGPIRFDLVTFPEIAA